MSQVDNWSEDDWQMPDARYEENLSVAEAYNDPRLQPAVMMKRLSDAQYVTNI